MHFCKRKPINKKINHSKVLSEDALTTWYSLTLTQQPGEGYPKQPAKNSVWLTNHGQCNRDTIFNYRSFTFADKQRAGGKKPKAVKRHFHEHKSWAYSVLFSRHKLSWENCNFCN